MANETESDIGHVGHGRSLGFILSATGTHWRALKRTNLNYFDSTKVPSFHPLCHLHATFNFNQTEIFKESDRKTNNSVLSCLSHNLSFTEFYTIMPITTSFMWAIYHYNSDSHEILTHEVLDILVHI